MVGCVHFRIEAARALEPGSIDQDLTNMKAVLEESKGNLGQVALKMGLVDQLVTEEEMRDQLIELIGSEEDETSYTGVGYGAYLAEQMTFEESDAGAESLSSQQPAALLMAMRALARSAV